MGAIDQDQSNNVERTIEKWGMLSLLHPRIQQVLAATILALTPGAAQAGQQDVAMIVPNGGGASAPAAMNSAQKTLSGSPGYVALRTKAFVPFQKKIKDGIDKYQDAKDNAIKALTGLSSKATWFDKQSVIDVGKLVWNPDAVKIAIKPELYKAASKDIQWEIETVLSSLDNAYKTMEQEVWTWLLDYAGTLLRGVKLNKLEDPREINECKAVFLNAIGLLGLSLEDGNIKKGSKDVYKTAIITESIDKIFNGIDVPAIIAFDPSKEPIIPQEKIVATTGTSTTENINVDEKWGEDKLEAILQKYITDTKAEAFEWEFKNYKDAQRAALLAKTWTKKWNDIKYELATTELMQPSESFRSEEKIKKWARVIVTFTGRKFQMYWQYSDGTWYDTGKKDAINLEEVNIDETNWLIAFTAKQDIKMFGIKPISTEPGTATVKIMVGKEKK